MKDKQPCIKCGKLIHVDVFVNLRTIMQLNRVRPEEYVETIANLEGLQIELAQEFVDHQMGHNCNRSEPPCPACAAPLKTWHAIRCLRCNWRRDPNRFLTEYYN